RSLGVLATDRLRLCENSPYDGPPCTALPAMTAPLELDGGTLQAAATFRIDRDVVIGSRSGTIDTNGFTLSLDRLRGDGSFTKTGAGTLALQGPASYGGATIIDAGTLQLGAGAALPSSTTLAVADSARFETTGQDVRVASLTGAGSVSLSGGSLTIN